MSTLLGIALGLIFGGWVIALVVKVGAISLIATLVAVALGVLYGIFQAALDIQWNDDFVLFWSVYGFFGFLGGACILIKCIHRIGKKYQYKNER